MADTDEVILLADVDFTGSFGGKRVRCLYNGAMQLILRDDIYRVLGHEPFNAYEPDTKMHRNEVYISTSEIQKAFLIALAHGKLELSSETRNDIVEFQQWITAVFQDLAMEQMRKVGKVYEKLPCFDTVYIMKEASELSSDAHKIGKSINPKCRERVFNTGSARGVRCIYKIKTLNAKIIEDMIKVVLRRYHLQCGGGTEHYSCNVEHSIDCIDVACVVVETLASSMEHMKRDELIGVLVDRLNVLRSARNEKKPGQQHIAPDVLRAAQNMNSEGGQDDELNATSTVVSEDEDELGGCNTSDDTDICYTEQNLNRWRIYEPPSSAREIPKTLPVNVFQRYVFKTVQDS